MSADLYVRDGSRFVLYDPVAQEVPPIPVPQRVDEQSEWRPNFTPCAAPRCPHGHFARWAAKHCRRCARAR